MSGNGRPAQLFPLFGEITGLEGIGQRGGQLLAGVGIEKPLDLLLTLPYSVIDRRPKPSIRGAAVPGVITLEVEVISHHPPRGRAGRYRVMVADAQERFPLVFFRSNGDYLQRALPVGQRRLVSGKLEMFDGVVQMVHPEHILDPGESAGMPAFEAVYSQTAGLTRKQLQRARKSALARVPVLDEWIDPALKAREGWPNWHDALQMAHAPAGNEDLSPQHPARARLAYDEMFAHQVGLALARSHMRRPKGRANGGNGKLRARVAAALTYKLTGAQERVIAEILADMASPNRMNRLLQGDVGAGKTLVALMALLDAVEAGGQGAFMAPTSILAQQHYAELSALAEAAGVRIDLLTGRHKGAARRARLEALASGETQILIGTHALFQSDVGFQDLRLAIVDEQHRFGVRQRLDLARKGTAVDVLVMTATPIPRSLALTQYGDMDVSVLDEKPPGRKPIKTALVSAGRYEEVVAHLEGALEGGRQAYWVCPLVEESEATEQVAAQARYETLCARLGDERVGLVHGRMSESEKDAAMARFQSGDTALLVATTVIEVGVNVPRASIMVIEQAEAFGLAQLHQLRGRVGRGSAESTCLLLYKPPLTATGEKRLRTLRDTEDGFVLAQTDLEMRGAGDLIGTAQTGLPRFRIADLESQSGLMATAQSDARTLLSRDPTLASPRGEAVRTLLWLMEQDRALPLIAVG